MSKYINRLTEEEIEGFFNNNGYILMKDLTDDNGLPIKAIERSEKDIFVRAQQINKDKINVELENYLIQKSPAFMVLSSLASIRSAYGRNIDLIHFSDFFMSKFCLSEEDEILSEELCLKYIKFMIEKFPNYKADFLKHCNTISEDEFENE